MGWLSPLGGMEPEEIGLPQLEERLRDEEIRELILAINATLESDVTAHVLQETPPVTVCRRPGWCAECRWAGSSSTWTPVR